MRLGRRGGGVLAAVAALALAACTNDGARSKAPAAGSSSDVAAGSAAGTASRDRGARLPALPRRLPADGTATADSPDDQQPPRGRWRRGRGDGQRGPRGDRPSRAEMREMYDTDHDGTLSDEERQVMRESRVAGMVDRLDSDRDGRLDRSELEAAPARGRRAPLEFDEVDADHDGYITVEEMAAAMPARRRGGRGWGRDGGRGAGSGSGSPPAGP